MKALDILRNALLEAGRIDIYDSPPPEETQFCLSKLNDLLDMWAGLKRYAWSMQFPLFTLQAGLSPHTIGPTGTFVTPFRPVRIENWDLLFPSTGQPIDLPRRIRDDNWWWRQRVKTLTNNIPTDLYYQPTWPNGTLNFWPIPNTSLQVRLETWVSLGQIQSVNTDLTTALPFGYTRALTLTLAEELSGPRSNDPKLAKMAQEARSNLQSNNIKSPRIASLDAGMPGSHKGDEFNWATGEPV